MGTLKVLLDSNPIYGDLKLDGPHVELILRYLSWTEEELLIPEVVIQEVVRQFKEKFEEYSGKIQSARETVALAGVQLPDIPSGPEAAQFYEQALRERIVQLNARVVPVPKVSTQELLDRDMRVAAPFDRKGRGMRDYLIWKGVIEELESHDHQIVLVTSDSAFYSESESEGGDESLHPDLVQDLLDRSIPAERVKLSRSLYHFGEKYARPLIDRVYREGEQVEGSPAEGIPTHDLVEAYGEATARELHQNISFILPLRGGYADRISFVAWPIGVRLILALDLGENVTQAIIRTGVEFETDVHVPVQVANRLEEFATALPVEILAESSTDDSGYITLTVHVELLVDLVFNWNLTTEEVEAFTVLRYGYTEEQLDESPMFLY